MNAQFNTDSIFRLLQKACSSTREMQAITIQQMENAGKQMHLLTKLNDKGLLLLMLSKILYEKYILFPRELTLFLANMFPIEKKPRVRRPKDEDDSRPFRRRKVKKFKDIDLNELSNQSITNPVNILPPMNRDIRQGLTGADQKQKISNANSKSDPPQVNLEEAMAQVDRQYGINAELTNPQQSDSSQTSSSNSSMRFGQIADYNKKMMIVGDFASLQANNRTVRRGRNNQGVNRGTTKKKIMIDEKISLDETEPNLSISERLQLTTEIVQMRHKYYEDYAHHRRFDENLDKCAQRFKKIIFCEENLQKLKRMGKKGKGHQSKIMPQPIEIYQNTDFTDQQTNSFMPVSTHFEPPDSTYREHLDSNIFHGEEKVTLNDLISRVNKPKWQVFQNLLWLSQQGQVILQQANPQNFGPIQIIKLKRE